MYFFMIDWVWLHNQEGNEVILDVELVFGKTFKVFEDTKDVVDEILDANMEFIDTKPSRG